MAYTISALLAEDIPAAAQMGADAFVADRHTEMKSYGVAEPYDMRAVGLQMIPGYLKSQRCVLRKAVDNETGELMGFSTWAFSRGFAVDEIPHVEGRVLPPAPKVAWERPPQPPVPDETEEPDGVKRLMALTDADMYAWETETMPPGTRCLIVAGLTVAPKFQGRGIGRALLQWGLDVCEEKGVFAWVHSSEPAWPMYHKCGFQVIRELDLDLDAYAPGPPEHEGPGAKWGHYVIRYMKYFPKNFKA